MSVGRVRWIGRVLVIALVVSGAYATVAAGQLPGVGSVLKKAVGELPATIAPHRTDPISTTVADAVTGIPALDSIRLGAPAPLTDLQYDGTGFRLRPGYFAMEAQSYCLHAGTYAPRRGDGYLLAPIKGSGADVVRHILQRSVAHPEIPQPTIQVLIWDILAHTKFEDLGGRYREAAAKLLEPQELVRLNRDALDVLTPSMMATVEAGMPTPIRDAFEAENQLRSMLVSTNSTYEQIEAVAVKAGVAPEDPSMRSVPAGRWSYVPGGYFVKYVPTGYSHTHVEVYVPSRITIDRDTLGRIVALSDSAGNRIETEYDSANKPLVVPGDPGLHGYAFKRIRYTAVDPSLAGGVQTAELTNVGWTFVGIPNGHARQAALPDERRSLFQFAVWKTSDRVPGGDQQKVNYDGWWERAQQAYEKYEAGKDFYDNVQTVAEYWQQLGEAAQPPNPDAIEDLTDLKHYEDGLKAASNLTDLRGKGEWIGNHLSMLQRAYAYVICALQGKCATGEFDPSGKVATPADTHQQRLGQSARLADYK